MWGMFESYVWASNQQMPAALKWTLVVLVHEAVHESDGSLVARVTQHDLARHTCSSRKTMIAHLAELERRHLVEKLGKAGEQAGLEYRLIPPSHLSQKVTGGLQVPDTKGDRSRVRYNERARESSSSLPLPLSLNRGIKKEIKTVQSIEDDRPNKFAEWRGELPASLKAEFQTFYGRYPRKINPDRAAKAFFYARRKATVVEMLEGLARAIESEEWAHMPKDGGSIIPHPASWLNAGGWKSEYIKKRETGTFGAGFMEFAKGGAG